MNRALCTAVDKAQNLMVSKKWQRAEDYVIPFHKALISKKPIIYCLWLQICVLRYKDTNGNHEHLRQARDEEEMGEVVEGAGYTDVDYIITYSF